MWWQIWSPNPIALDLGIWTIHLYGLIIALAVYSAYLVTRKLDKKNNNPSSTHSVDWADCLLWVIIGGFLGARLLHVVIEWPYYWQQPLQIFQVWNGGLAIHGGLLGGALSLWLYARRRSINFFQLTDLVVPGVALAQAIGRWGNYFNQELYGTPTSGWWGILIESPYRLPGYEQWSLFHPIFLYESLGLLILFVILWKLSGRQQLGYITAYYFIGYGCIRFLVDFLRIDPQPGWQGLRLGQLESVVLVIIALTILYIKKQPRGV